MAPCPSLCSLPLPGLEVARNGRLIQRNYFAINGGDTVHNYMPALLPYSGHIGTILAAGQKTLVPRAPPLGPGVLLPPSILRPCCSSMSANQGPGASAPLSSPQHFHPTTRLLQVQAA